LFAVTILGNNSAIPAFGRNPTSQFFQNQDCGILIDCGEGTQMQLAKYKVKPSKISHILISHLHGDHYFGLIGLITSMSLMNRVQALHLHGPEKLIDILNIQLAAANVVLSYELFFHPLTDNEKIIDSKKLEVNCFEVKHKINCWGFLFKEKKNPRSVNPSLAKSFDIPAAFFEQLQKGEDYINKKGTIIKNEDVTHAATRPKSYAYCADTIFDLDLVNQVKNVDLLYHETTYLKDLEDKAAERFHSTTIQAATIAKLSNAKQLLIGHFSSKYENIDLFLTEAISVFENTLLATEGTCFKI